MPADEPSAAHTYSITWTDAMHRVLVELQQRRLLHRLLAVAAQGGVQLYLVGGALRDICRGHPVHDLDLAMAGDVMSFARRVASLLGAAYVPLDAARGEARVVYHKHESLDFAQFKGDSIIADLQHRDFTINAMACPLTALLTRAAPDLIDPHGGWQDLRARRIRMVSHLSFGEDPLRLLRAFRFAAQLDFGLDPVTCETMQTLAPRLREVAAERIQSELLKLFAAPSSSPHLMTMARLGLLDSLFPELATTRGLPCRLGQPLELFTHAIQTYQAVEAIIHNPDSHLPQIAPALRQYFLAEERQALVKWAGLLHAIGAAVAESQASSRPATACGNSLVSAQLWEQIGSRLKLSRKHLDCVHTFIAHSGRALELAIGEAQEHLTVRRMYGWCKALGDSMLGVLVLALGHTLAAGPADTACPSAVALRRFATRMWEVYRNRILPVITAPRLITGDDLQQIFHLPPGPRFKSLLNDLEVAQVEGQIRTRDEALQWVEAQLR